MSLWFSWGTQYSRGQALLLRLLLLSVQELLFSVQPWVTSLSFGLFLDLLLGLCDLLT